jgi:amidase
MDAGPDRRTFLKLAGGGAALGAVGRASTDVGAQSVRSASAERSDDLCFRSARDLAALIQRKEVSAREVMAAHLDRINRVNPSINAIVAKLDDDRCPASVARRAAVRRALSSIFGF